MEHPAPRSRSPHRRNPARHPLASTRDRILQAALETFAERGFAGASTREIAAAAGVNQGLITYHFATKDALWKAAVNQLFGALRTEFSPSSPALPPSSAAGQLRDTIARFVRFSATHPELHRFMVQEGKLDGPRLRWLVDRHIRPLFALGRSTIEGVQAQGVLPGLSSSHLFYLFIGAAAHIFVVAPEFRRLTGEDPTTAESIAAHADALTALFLGAPTA